jgi:diadenosine tetraphosphatase ApaH/serine/threonine PP2A family protein phosphatase
VDDCRRTRRNFTSQASCCLISLKTRAGNGAMIDREENVRLAIFADIHANRQAFRACLDFARARGAERIICLGDIVGYGADPEWAVDTVMGLVDDGAIAVIGNHDHAISTPSETMNAVAQAAIEWTRGRLSRPQRRFLAGLPLTRQEDDRLYVHSEASHPARWYYVRDTPDAARSIAATDAHVTFCGHIHRPALYSMSSAAKMTSFIPTSDVPVQLLGGRRWLAVLGSVGQPRDGDPAASFAMLDTASRELTYCRVPYDVEAAADRIRANGLPHWLADRLLVGK